MTSGKTPQQPWLEAAQQFQQNLIAQWTQAAQAFPGAAAQAAPQGATDPFAAFKAFMPQSGAAHPFGMAMPQVGAGMGMAGMGDMFNQAAGHKVHFDPAKLLEIQNTYMKDVAGLWNHGLDAKPQADRRFASEAWASNPVAAFSAAAYLLNARTLMALADAVEGDAKTRTRVRFAVQQWIDASAPSNFLAFNAEAQKMALESKGESIAKGMANLLHDMKQGHVSMTDESVFEVGKNVATTEGAVVFENELFQLIEYKPLTAKVYERPFLLVPPCINKFYILDLQPENSLIRYCVEQGHRTFVVSWRNPDESLAKKTWDNYIEDAVIRAIGVTQDRSAIQHRRITAIRALETVLVRPAAAVPLDHGVDAVIDARAPAEFAEDRLPRAVSMPVLMASPQPSSQCPSSHSSVPRHSCPGRSSPRRRSSNRSSSSASSRWVQPNSLENMGRLWRGWLPAKAIAAV